MKLFNKISEDKAPEYSFSVDGNFSGRYLVMVEDGEVTIVQDAEGYNLVRSDGYRTLRSNLVKVYRQLRWLDGEWSDTALDDQLLDADW